MYKSNRMEPGRAQQAPSDNASKSDSEVEIEREVLRASNYEGLRPFTSGGRS